MSNDQLVSQLKACINAQANGFPIERQKLVYKGRTMQDTNLIGDYNLEDGCKVHLILLKEESPRLGQASPSLSLSSATSCPINVSQSSNQARTHENQYHRSTAGAAQSMTTASEQQADQTENKSSLEYQPGSRFELVLRERLTQYFLPPAVERIMAKLQHEINADINSSSLDDLERLAIQKLNISNE